jgi:DNA-damage-inducible protein J
MEHNVATKSLENVMASSNDVVRARIDGHIKEEATNVLSGMGLSISDAIRILLTRIATDKALPFDINRVQAQPSIKKP